MEGIAGSSTFVIPRGLLLSGDRVSLFENISRMPFCDVSPSL